MARIRTIKPQHCADKELPKLSLQAHLLWILNWCFSDDAGVFENDPLLIKSNLFPRRQDIRVEQINQWLGQLAEARFIVPFTYKGVGYYINRTFHIHQLIDKPQPSIIPSDIILGIIKECSENVLSCIVKESNSKGKEGEGSSLPPAAEKNKDGFQPTPEQEELFQKFKDWMDKNTPTVAKMDKPLTIRELFVLRGVIPNSTGKMVNISREECQSMLLSIENNKQYLKKFRSPYLCILAWHKRNSK